MSLGMLIVIIIVFAIVLFLLDKGLARAPIDAFWKWLIEAVVCLIMALFLLERLGMMPSLHL